MRVLVVGAGAIGQVFGLCFQQGGAEVSFLVRPKYADAARRGFVMYRQNSAPHTPLRFEGFGVQSDQDEAMEQPWDLVVLALSSVALRSGDWLERLGQSMGPANLLCLVPETDGPEYIASRFPEGRVAWGMLSVISFQAPLASQPRLEPGVAFWFPPLSALGFGGPDAVVNTFLPVLKRGGMPAKRVDSVHAEVAIAGPILDKVILSLACAGWTFQGLRRDPDLLHLAVQAIGEAWVLAERVHGVKPPVVLRLLRPFMLRWTLWLAPHVLPFDLEQFFDFHYHKVGEQTRMHMADQLAACEAHGVDNPAMRELASRVKQGRGLE
jgi:2-dehydropantoate 2-reductase